MRIPFSQRRMCQASYARTGPTTAAACRVVGGTLVKCACYWHLLALPCISQACPNFGNRSLYHSLLKQQPLSGLEDFATLSSVCVMLAALPGYLWFIILSIFNHISITNFFTFLFQIRTLRSSADLRPEDTE